MKKSLVPFICLLILSIISFSNPAFGTAISDLEIETLQNHKMFLLSFKTEGRGDVNIKIVDQYEHTIFATSTKKKKSFEKIFNLKQLENGVYTLSIDDEFRVVIQTIRLNFTGLEIDNEQRKQFYKPQVSMSNSGKMLNINWLMNTQRAYQLTIEDESSSILFEHELNNYDIHQQYNLSSFPSGLYYLTIKNESQVYYKTIKVE